MVSSLIKSSVLLDREQVLPKMSPSQHCQWVFDWWDLIELDSERGSGLGMMMSMWHNFTIQMSDFLAKSPNHYFLPDSVSNTTDRLCWRRCISSHSSFPTGTVCRRQKRPGACAAKMDNVDKQGCIHVLKNHFFLFSSWGYSCGNKLQMWPFG